MISSIYAGSLGLIIAWLSFNVIKLRRANKIRLGDGGLPVLQNAIRAQGNAAEYIPVALILLALLEMNNASRLLIHAAGIALIAGRLIHARGLLDENLRDRVLGMQLTLFTIIGLAALNIFYGLYPLSG